MILMAMFLLETSVHYHLKQKVLVGADIITSEVR